MEISDFFTDLFIIGMLLLAGTLIRSRVNLLQRFVIPASVIGGLFGLFLGPHGLEWIPISGMTAEYPILLLDIVFAGLFIGKTIPAFRKLLKVAGAQAAYAYFNAFGQITVGLAVVLIFGAIGTALSPGFGIELLAGFQGGPGVPTSIAPLFEKLGWPASESALIGETCAVSGLILSILVGIIIVNIGITRKLTVKSIKTRDIRLKSETFPPVEQRCTSGWEITNPDAVNSLAFNFGILATAIISGKLLLSALIVIIPTFKFIPSFPFAMIMGLVMQLILQKTRLNRFLDRGAGETISGFSLDVLIVASLVSIDYKTISLFALPLFCMILAGLLFNLLQLKWMAPRVLPGAWFEKGLCEFGQGTGSIPQALLLLRMVDARMESEAAEAIGLKMVLFSPVIFPVTLMILIPMAFSRGPLPVMLTCLALMAVVLVICRIWCWQEVQKNP